MILIHVLDATRPFNCRKENTRRSAAMYRASDNRTDPSYHIGVSFIARLCCGECSYHIGNLWCGHTWNAFPEQTVKSMHMLPSRFSNRRLLAQSVLRCPLGASRSNIFTYRPTPPPSYSFTGMAHTKAMQSHDFARVVYCQ